MEYYLVRCVKNDGEFFCIWCSGEKDVFFCNEHSKMISFGNSISAHQFLSKHHLSLEDASVPTYDFDNLEKWILKGETIDNCGELLNFWNMFSDAALSAGYAFMGDQNTNALNEIYDELFYGCNILTPDNEDPYSPYWEKEQLHLAKNVLQDGMTGFFMNVESSMA